MPGNWVRKKKTEKMEQATTAKVEPLNTKAKPNKTLYLVVLHSFTACYLQQGCGKTQSERPPTIPQCLHRQRPYRKA